MKFLLVAITFLFVFNCQSDEDLTPFIAWSDNDLLSRMQTKYNIDDLTSDLSKLEAGKVDLVILFNSRKLSFSGIAQNGGVFYETSSALEYLKNEFESSRSQYWTGYRSIGANWMAELANKMRLGIQYKSDRELKNASMLASYSDPNNLLVINLQGDDIKAHDHFINSIMTKVREMKLTYLAIYTSNTELRHLIHPRSINDKIKVKGGEENSVDNNCPVGGLFNKSEDGSPCMLFCMNNNVVFTPNASNSAYTCSLSSPYNVTGCCESDLNKTLGCMNESYPFVKVEYVIENVTQYSDANSCHRTIFDESVFPVRPEAPHFENARPQILVILKFMFPSYQNSSTPNSWNVTINVTHSYIWLEEDKVEPEEAPEDDKNQGTITFFSITQRESPSQNLYTAFKVNFGLSYSCGSNEYNFYSTSAINGSSVLLEGMQVQPYNVSSNVFSSADNCAGYLTITAWMGIIAVSLLILILYISIVAAFSIAPVDEFEDSREETIKIEKMH
ncbi:PREDICTED: uncharacterized protein LOC109584369 isoform X3 [Amphimedon queenslandica]|uniref:V-type proton ATPase subunit S1/VOA1 transmembrane domain-containing protein n=1 Tax=Amphimedon queenslandica TaxID=400682 RepID=A0AAN0JFR1_AMPQE|nr:PREDICTED: uncharacterized protein LOC109584369 isoform X3 [Amphimedon queenslandica]|eukprot:XP_019855641.1 PREDICTED: uncharacterized protein LOC109584369 isoform X3 [Amphimedon queenslandica]